LIEQIANSDFNKLQEIIEQEYILSDTIINKISYLYHSKELLPIYSIEHLKNFAEEYEIDVSNKNYFEINKELLNKLYLE
jgi:hypothetical protein